MNQYQALFLLVIGASIYAQDLPSSNASLADPVPRILEQLNSPEISTRSIALVDLYEHSHFSLQTRKAIDAVEEIFHTASHQELKAEAGTVLIEFYRQQGRLDKIEQTVKELGFIEGWQILGPLKPDSFLSQKFLSKRPPLSHEGMNRTVVEHAVPAFGSEHYYSVGSGHFGYFNANMALFPSQLTSAYFRSWFYSDGKTPLRLGLGWFNKLNVWVNGHPLADLKGEQIPHTDQNVVYFTIRKGWHQLSLRTESNDEKSILGFYARLTTKAGDAVPTSLTWKKKKKSKPKLLNRASIEVSLLESATKYGEKNIAGMMLQKEIEKLSETPKNLLLKAFKNNPDRWVTEQLIHLEETPNKNWDFLNTFLKKHPKNPWGLAQKGTIALMQSRFWEARKYAKQVIEMYPEYWQAHLLENNTLAHMNLYGESLRRTVELKESHGDIPWLLMDLCDLYAEMDLDEEMYQTLNQIRKIRHISEKFNERRIRYLINKEKTGDLLEFYQELVRESPDKLSLFLNYIDFLSANDKKTVAEELLMDYTRVFPENPYLLEALGNVQMELQRETALGTFKKILEITPQSPKIEKMIQLYHAGENAFYSVYRIEGTQPETEPQDGIVINIHNTVKKISPSGLSSEFHQIEFEVVEEQGIKTLQGHAFSYSPLRQHVEILKSEVRRSDQTILFSKYRRSRLSDPTYKTYYDLVSVQIPFPTLKVGDHVLLEYRIDDVGKNIFGHYYGGLMYFTQSFPVATMKYTLILPRSLPFQYQIHNITPEYTFRESGRQAIHEWTSHQIPIMESEPMMPPPQPHLPYLTYSSFGSWDEMATWYHELVKEQLILDPETRNIVAGLMDGLVDRREIVKNIHEFVIKHTRYVALEFGIHGYKPYQVNKVCSRQFGDCKDKASLIVAMLREAGIKASIAIVRTSDKGMVDKKLANLSHFNHAIAYVPEFDLFLDGTAEYSGMDELPAMDQGALTFVIDENGKGTLRQIPIDPPEKNTRARTMRLELRKDGLVHINGALVYSGIHAARMRRFLEGEGDSEDAIAQICSFLIPGFHLLDSSNSSTEINEPVEISFSGTSSQVLLENQTILPLELLASELLPALAPTAERDFDLWLDVPEHTKTTLVVRAPGKTFHDVPENLNLNTPWFKVEVSFDISQVGTLKIEYAQLFLKTRVPLEHYSEFRTSLNQHDQLLNKFIRID